MQTATTQGYSLVTVRRTKQKIRHLVTCYYGDEIFCTAKYIMDIIQAVTEQPSSLRGCQKEKGAPNRYSSEKTINTPSGGKVTKLFDLIVLPGTSHAGTPLIGITQKIKFRTHSPKYRRCGHQRRYHQSVHSKSAALNKKRSSFTGRGPCLSAPCRVRIGAEEDLLESPLRGELKCRKKTRGICGSKSSPSLTSVHPIVASSQGGFNTGRVQSSHGLLVDSFLDSKSVVTRERFEICDLIRSRPGGGITLSQHLEAGDFELAFVTYDMEEAQQTPQSDVENPNEEPGEEYDPFYKCAFEFARKHGYGFVEFVEEKAFGKKPKKRVLRKKCQTILVKKDDRVNPVYSVSSSSKKYRNHRDRCLAKPKGNCVGLSNETLPFKLSGYGKIKKTRRDVDKVGTRSLPVKTGLGEFGREVSPRLKTFSKARSAVSVTEALIAIHGRVDRSQDHYHGGETMLSSVKEARTHSNVRFHNDKGKAGNTVFGRSASNIVDGTVNNSKSTCLTAASPQRDEAHSSLNSQALGDKTAGCTLDMLKKSIHVRGPSDKKNRDHGNRHKTNTSDEKLIPVQQISAVVSEEATRVKEPRMVLPRLKDSTSLEYKLCNSMSATIFRETQRVHEVAEMKKHSDILSVANVDVVHFAYQPFHGEDRNRAPSCECPTRIPSRVRRVLKSSQCVLSAGSSYGVCGRRKPHGTVHAAHSSQVLCDRVESWPCLLPHNSSSLFRSPEATIATCGTSPPMAKMMSTVGDSPTKFEVNFDSSSKTFPQSASVNTRKGGNEQGLDLETPTDSNGWDLIFPASVPLVKDHCRLQLSVGPYHFDDGDFRELKHSLISYSSRASKSLATGKSKVATLDKATRGKKPVTSNSNQASVNNNKCVGYCKRNAVNIFDKSRGFYADLSNVYGECSYSPGTPLDSELEDSSCVEDTNNNAVVDLTDRAFDTDDNACIHDIQTTFVPIVNSEYTPTAQRNVTVQQKIQLVRDPVSIQAHQHVRPSLIRTRHDSQDFAATKTAIGYRRDDQKQRLRNMCVCGIRDKSKRAQMVKGFLKTYNCCYTNKMKKKKSSNPVLKSKSGQFSGKTKQREHDTASLVTCQSIKILNGNNNNSKKVNTQHSASHKTTFRAPRWRASRTRRQPHRKNVTGKRVQRKSKGKRPRVKNPRYSVTDKGWRILQKKNATATYCIGPAGYKTLYEALRQRCDNLQPQAPLSKWLRPSSGLGCSCNVMDKIVDRFRNLIALFPQRRLLTLQKILGLTVCPRATVKPASRSSTESRCSSSPSKFSADANTCKSRRHVYKQRPGTIYQSVVPSPDTCCNNLINPLSHDYCATCGKPQWMTRTVQAGTCQVANDDGSPNVRPVDLQPVDSLTLAKERLSKGKEMKDATRMSGSDNTSENACSKKGPNERECAIPTEVINDIIATPILNQGPFGKPAVHIFPVTQQPENTDVTSGISKPERKMLQYKNYLWPGKLSLQSCCAVGNNNHGPKTIKWDLCLHKEIKTDNNCLIKSQENPRGGPSAKGASHLKTCTGSFTETYRGKMLGKTGDLTVENSVDELDAFEYVLKREAEGSDHLELQTKADSIKSFEILGISSTKNENTGEQNIAQRCPKDVSVDDCDTRHPTQAGPKVLLNLVTRKLVEEFFNDYPTVNEDGTHVEHAQNNKCPNQTSGSSETNSEEFTTGISNMSDSCVKIPNSEVIISKCSNKSYPNVIDHSVATTCQNMGSKCNLQPMTIHDSKCDTQESKAPALTSLHSVASESILAGSTISRPAHASNCIQDATGGTYPYTPSGSSETIMCDQKRVSSTNSEINVMKAFNRTHIDTQTNNLADENISGKDSSDLSLSSSLTQAYLKVNSPGISTHWVCVLPGIPAQTCSKSSGKSSTTGSCNDSTLQPDLTSEESGSSFRMTIVTSNQNSDNQLSSTDDEEEVETENYNHDTARKESSSSAEISDIAEATTLNRQQPSSNSGSSVASTVSNSQCNNNNSVLSLNRLRLSELDFPKDHMETAWRTSRKPPHNDAPQGMRVTLVADNQSSIKLGRGKSCAGQLHQQAEDRGSLLENSEDTFMGSHEICRSQNRENYFGDCQQMLCENHENLIAGNHENVITGNHEDLINENHEILFNENQENVCCENQENLHHLHLKDLLSGNGENLHMGNHVTLHGTNNEFPCSGNNESWPLVNPEMTPEINHDNSQSVTSCILNSKLTKPVSRKRRMNEPLADLAPPSKVRRLNNSLLQPLDEEETCLGDVNGTNQTKQNRRGC